MHNWPKFSCLVYLLDLQSRHKGRFYATNAKLRSKFNHSDQVNSSSQVQQAVYWPPDPKISDIYLSFSPLLNGEGILDRAELSFQPSHFNWRLNITEAAIVTARSCLPLHTVVNCLCLVLLCWWEHEAWKVVSTNWDTQRTGVPEPFTVHPLASNFVHNSMDLLLWIIDQNSAAY